MSSGDMLPTRYWLCPGARRRAPHFPQATSERFETLKTLVLGTGERLVRGAGEDCPISGCHTGILAGARSALVSRGPRWIQGTTIVGCDEEGSGRDGGSRRERRDFVVQSPRPKAKNMNRIRTLIDRLDRSLRDTASPVSGIIQDCLTLARVAEEREWQLYFNLQLLGFELGRHPESSPALSTGDPKTFNWQPAIRFAEDRTGADKQIQGLSVQHLETFLRNSEAALSEGDDDLTAKIKEHNVFFRLDSLKAKAAAKDNMREVTAFLDIARTRAREFVSVMDAKEYEVMSNNGSSQSRIFIGHGRAAIWQTLALFLSERLSLAHEEFNRESVAGRSTVERLEEMLGHASFAFIVFTGEDEGADGSLRARENVVHEAGLFQGRLGFKKAIILLEDGCHEFSNIQGLGQIRFPRGDIEKSYEQIRGVLEREGLL